MTSTILVIAMLLAQAISAPQNGVSTIKSPVNMTLEELNYLLQVRSGQPQTQPKVLSPCARAILGCCRDKIMNPSCSESLNCGALFFDVNPCEERFVNEALKAASSFYEQLNNVST